MIPDTAAVAEGGSVMICAQMAAISAAATLGTEVVVILTTVDGTATAGNGDYSSLSVFLTFAPGSTDGAEMCESVVANSDRLVESEENFKVQLALGTLGGSNLRLGNSLTAITLTDSNGMVL